MRHHAAVQGEELDLEVGMLGELCAHVPSGQHMMLAKTHTQAARTDNGAHTRTQFCCCAGDSVSDAAIERHSSDGTGPCSAAVCNAQRDRDRQSWLWLTVGVRLQVGAAVVTAMAGCRRGRAACATSWQAWQRYGSRPAAEVLDEHLHAGC
jgi:hypothetical protein